MKNKSYIKGDYLDLAAAGTLRYGEIIAESYYKTNKNGVYTESTPNTSEILNQWFWPVVNCFELRNNYFFIGEWCTDLLFESYTQGDGVTTERIIFKPTPENLKTTPEFIQAELDKAFSRIYRNPANNN